MRGHPLPAIPEVIAHAGPSGGAPSNSRAAMERAIEIGPDRIECDVQRSRDGHLVLVHDDRIPGPDGSPVQVRQLSTAELRARLPGLLHLDDLAEMAKGRAPLMIDIKGPGYEVELAGAIRRHELASTSSVASTHALVLRRLRSAFPTMRLGLSTGHLAGSMPTRPGRHLARAALRAAMPRVILPALWMSQATETMLHHQIASARLVAAVHSAGRRVNLWTVDEEEEIRQAIALGVDGIISNRPRMVRSLIQESGDH